MADMKW